MNAIKRGLSSQSDIALVVGVLAILLILFAPIPSAALDFLIIVNFAFGLTILLLTFFVARPVDFSTFPSLLLVATLFRLSLNVAATRLILSSGQAGDVIGAVGTFVVQNNYVIGLIVFLILVIVQYVVVTNGAQRVSEVAARFVLDGMPGQQMSIDADLNMGFIDQEEAKRRRKLLEKEAGFYGAMDGASKFVKGDAIAGIIILLINIIGGLVIGVSQMGMTWGTSLHTFTLLTIGDGIVTQVPALIVSVATGIIVTRSSADKELSAEIVRQLMSFPKIQIIVSIALVALMMLPGMPKWPVLVIAGVTLIAYFFFKKKSIEIAEASSITDVATSDTDQLALTPPAPIEISFGSNIASQILPVKQVLLERIASFRSQLASELGFVVPPVSLKEVKQLSQDSYEISLVGNKFGNGLLYLDRSLALHSSAQPPKMEGMEVRDPTFGLPGVWIEPKLSDKAKRDGFTLVDPMTVLMTHLIEVTRTHLNELLSRAEVVKLVEGVRTRQPGLIEELVPTVMAISDIQRVLQGLLIEGVSIRNLDLIIEILTDIGRFQKDPSLLTEQVRQRLGLSICQQLRGDKDALQILTIDPALEASIVNSVKGAQTAPGMLIDPRLAEQILMRLVSLTEAMIRSNLKPVLLCAPEIRRHLKTFTSRVVPKLAVISVAEIPLSIGLRSFGVLSTQTSQLENQLSKLN